MTYNTSSEGKLKLNLMYLVCDEWGLFGLVNLLNLATSIGNFRENGSFTKCIVITISCTSPILDIRISPETDILQRQTFNLVAILRIARGCMVIIID